jgi:uncharacterized protein (TIGR03000 family)
MRKLVFGLAVLLVLAVSENRAAADGLGFHGPWPQTAAFPCMNPPGWYTNTYSFAWQYPWFAYYNYSQGPYANWMAGGGFATYANCPCGHQMYRGVAPVIPPPSYCPIHKMGGAAGAGVMGGGVAAPCVVTVNLPADAKLLFNGTAAQGNGAVRKFSTSDLQPGQDYGYELTAEVVRNGRVERHTEKVVLRAGEKTEVTLAPGGAGAVTAR